MKPRLCAWGDCHDEFVAITMNYYGEERPSFCCNEHAALWLMRHAAWRNDAKKKALFEHMEQILTEKETTP